MQSPKIGAALQQGKALNASPIGDTHQQCSGALGCPRDQLHGLTVTRIRPDSTGLGQNYELLLLPENDAFSQRFGNASQSKINEKWG